MTRAAALWSLSSADRDARWRAGTVPDPSRYAGRMRGTLLPLRNHEQRFFLIRWLWRFLTATHLLLWRGKRLWRSDHEHLATNLVGLWSWPAELLTMTLVDEESLVEPGLRVLAVRYDRPENPRFLHVVRDELREIEDGLLLGRMVVQGAGRARWWLWFGLER